MSHRLSPHQVVVTRVYWAIIDLPMSRRLKWVLIGIALLLVLFAYWLDHKYPFPPLVRNDKMIVLDGA